MNVDEEMALLFSEIETNLRGNDEHFHAEASQLAQRALGWYSPLKWFNPTNMVDLTRQITVAVRSGTAPQIEATYLPLDYAAARAANSDLESASGLVRHHFAAAALLDKAAELRGFFDVGDDEAALAAWSTRAYGEVPQETIDAAGDLWSAAAAPDEIPTVDAHIIAGAMQSALNFYGLAHWRVEFVGIAAKVAVEGVQSLIKVQPGARATVGELQRLIAHEIGRHVLSLENARRQPDPLACLALGWQPTATEEGMGAWMEQHLVPTQDGNRMTLFAARALAVHWSRDHGVVEIARRLHDKLPLPVAVATAVRVKRGIRHMHQPGGTTKDHQYLSGFLKIKHYLDDNPNHVAAIQATKWTLEQLPDVNTRLDDGRLQPPTHNADALREFFTQDPRGIVYGSSK